jgi:hypothetical protein
MQCRSRNRNSLKASLPRLIREIEQMLRKLVFDVPAAAYLMPLLAGCATSTHLSHADMSQIAKRTYVIVGASSGFGRGTGAKLGTLHANVVLAARRTEVAHPLGDIPDEALHSRPSGPGACPSR